MGKLLEKKYQKYTSIFFCAEKARDGCLKWVAETQQPQAINQEVNDCLSFHNATIISAYPNIYLIDRK